MRTITELSFMHDDRYPARAAVERIAPSLWEADIEVQDDIEPRHWWHVSARFDHEPSVSDLAQAFEHGIEP